MFAAEVYQTFANRQYVRINADEVTLNAEDKNDIHESKISPKYQETRQIEVSQKYLRTGGLPVALFGPIATSMAPSVRHQPIELRLVTLKLHRRGGQGHLQLR
jgi:hypothetical protein